MSRENSGVPVEMQVAFPCSLRDGLVVRVQETEYKAPSKLWGCPSRPQVAS